MDLKETKFLVIVESPNKVSTISSILKKAGYKKATVMASVGHIMELGNGGNYYNSGIEPSKDFEMNLKISADKVDVVRKLTDQVKAAELVYLMSDGDREGEAIAWSLIKFLKIAKTKYRRAITHEITPKAVIAAIENPIKLSESLVDAALARMTVDKMIGFALSPVAQTYVGAKSVGRCQSAGLKLVADREKEIQLFVPETYIDLYLNFKKNSTKFKAKYIGTAKTPIEHLKTDNEVKTIKAACKDNAYTIANIKTRQKQESPKPPFCTATFQQEAASKLGLKVKDAMACAQKLFEGISVKGEHIGLITYMRTDATDLAPEFLPELKKYIESTYGSKTFTTPRVGKKAENDQEGHEALRVVDPKLTPELLANHIKNDLLIKVYRLIWQRTIAAAMPNAVLSETTYEIQNGEHKFNLVSNELLSPGYRSVYSYLDDDAADEGGPVKETFKQGEVLSDCKLDDVKKQTKPKPRYTEATLIKELQKREIGRPSTYVTIVETVLSQTRNYCTLEDKSIVPTEKGLQLASFLDRAFSDLINLEYTKDLEKDLDSIANNKTKKLDFLRKFHSTLEGAIRANIETTTNATQLESKMCPKCGASMVVRRSRFGKLFYGCSKYPKCNGIININK